MLSTKKDAFRLDDQSQAHSLAGQPVRVTGTLDAKTNVIHVIKIEADQ